MISLWEVIKLSAVVVERSYEHRADCLFRVNYYIYDE